MALHIEDADRVPARELIDRFRAIAVRLDLADEPVHASDGMAVVFADLARKVDDRHRVAERRALAALARGDIGGAVAILQDVTKDAA